MTHTHSLSLSLINTSSSHSLLDYLTMLFQELSLYSIGCSRKIIMNGEYVRICNETIETLLKVLNWHSPGAAERNHENFQ